MRTSVRIFDRYVVVDWSANSRPKRGKDSIWIQSLGASERHPGFTDNLRTRAEAGRCVRRLLIDAVDRDERVLVGFDFAYGYPSGFAEALGLRGIPWRATWDHLVANIEDEPDNTNNRFTVAAEMNAQLPADLYWGCPAREKLDRLSSKKDRVRYRSGRAEVALSEWRQTDKAAVDGRSRPKSVWQLFGAGAVGSQSLVGIPVLAALRGDPSLRECSLVWPFEVDMPALPAGRPAIIHAEVWPSLPDRRLGDAESSLSGQVKDQIQVEQLAARLRDRDTEGSLGEWFDVPPDCAAEEGWILGVEPPAGLLLHPINRQDQR